MIELEFSGEVSNLIIVYQNLVYFKSKNYTNLKPCLKFSSIHRSTQFF